MNELQRLQRWYRTQCNEDWEHSYGVKIDTLDNPGWTVAIDLAETVLLGKHFEPLTRGHSEDDPDWIFCSVVDNRFVGHGGAGNLSELLGVFLEWADA